VAKALRLGVVCYSGIKCAQKSFGYTISKSNGEGIKLKKKGLSNREISDIMRSEVNYRWTRTAWRVTQWTEIPPTSGSHLSVGSGSV
jgi:hypothetical protein